MCKNDFLETVMKYQVVNMAFAAIMNRPGYLLDSIIARKVSAPVFLHSLGQSETFRDATLEVRLRRYVRCRLGVQAVSKRGHRDQLRNI